MAAALKVEPRLIVSSGKNEGQYFVTDAGSRLGSDMNTPNASNSEMKMILQRGKSSISLSDP